MPSPKLIAVRSRLIVLFACLVAGPSGCAATRESRAPGRPDVVTEGIEVWAEREPARDFVETGDLAARTTSRAETIAKLQKQAQRLYMSGIYNVECGGRAPDDGGAGACSATGFVYRDAQEIGHGDAVELVGASRTTLVQE